jgi:hypothetical protein
MMQKCGSRRWKDFQRGILKPSGTFTPIARNTLQYFWEIFASLFPMTVLRRRAMLSFVAYLFDGS